MAHWRCRPPRPPPRCPASSKNRGTATLSTSTNLWIWNAGTFLNTANATFVANITSGTFTARGDGGTNLFQNDGTFRKQGAGTLQFTTNNTVIAFSNTGSLDAQAGGLSILGGSTSSGRSRSRPVQRSALAARTISVPHR
ncbi:MAG: hypothetical protein IPK26_13060 [Planctomycetes bacterium]|nr:hypothetical protein [Planctomycetota bacterium]